MDKMSTMGGPAGSRDPLYDQPYVDIDEWRDAPARHRYVHGGFKGTECRFSFYFPPTERYEGRFFQPLMAVSGTENAALSPAMQGQMIGESVPFAMASGGYLVESNQGRTVMFPSEDGTITGYRASAAVAKYSRVLAAEMYGAHRPYGYAYGGSGGAYKTFACLENCPGVWDGGVPFVQGSPMSIPYMFMVQGHAIRVLRDKFPAIVDALEPGGSGDMYSGLNTEEREALAEVTRMGCPPRAWFSYERIALAYTGILSMFLDNMLKWDPEYFKDFWTVPGYLGQNPPESLLRERVQHKAKISKVVKTKEVAALGTMVSMPSRLADSEGEMPAAVKLEKMPAGNLQGNTMTLTSGAVAGHVLYIAGVVGDLVMVGFGETNFQELVKMKAGDEVLIDNGTYLAAQTYHRHQIPSPDYHVWNQFLVNGKPVYPQRPALLGPRYTRYAMGSTQTGRFAGKMIVVESMMDEAAFPWQADWYRMQVQAALGPRLDDHYRLWFVDNAMHTAPTVMLGDRRPVASTRIINYTGVVQQALRDLSAWVEKGWAPPSSTTYKMVDGQVQVPPTAAERKGIQPVVMMKANGGERAEVAVGETVEFTAVIEVPPGTGTVVSAKWDFEGAGDYPVAEQFDDINSSFSRVTLKTTYAFSKPGTYFPALRATSQRQGVFKTRYARIHNLGRVRVVVQ
jgi:hypothetical protein